MKILHIATDEKFINSANRTFEIAFPNSNHFIILHSIINSALKYVDKTSNIEIIHRQKNSEIIIAKKCEKFDCIILHSISLFNSTVFLESSVKNRFIGMIWGAEVYNNFNIIGRNVLGPNTSKIKSKFDRHSLKVKFKNLIKNIIYNKYILYPFPIQITLKRLNYISVLHKEEYNYFIKKNIISKNCRFVPFTYYPLEYIMKGNDKKIITGNNILLGNSASLTNNHLEAFEILRDFKIDCRKIITPLSYGNIQYAKYIKSIGYKKFGSSFQPLLSFMPLHEYNNVIQSCGIVVMNHYRQQAEGNILAAIWLGSKVYLNKSNTVYHYLKRIGIYVFSIENDLVPDNIIALQNLTFDEIKHNRNILVQEIGEDKIVIQLRDYISKFPPTH